MPKLTKEAQKELRSFLRVLNVAGHRDAPEGAIFNFLTNALDSGRLTWFLVNARLQLVSKKLARHIASFINHGTN